ncbi:hypothetical protein BC827DRAFT_1230125 [Russula dissimulans]|nr:hypothetical protein BC827DRAFT_1230125 [Russula dissimulans]
MQLRTILISTGILAFVTSFTSGGPTPAIPAAGPGKRTNVNRNVGSVQVDISPNDDGQVFNQNDPISFIGCSDWGDDGSPLAVTLTGGLGVCCYLGTGDSSEPCIPYDFQSNQFQGDQYFLWQTSVSFGTGERSFDTTTPSLSASGASVNAVPNYPYVCQYGFLVEKSTDENIARVNGQLWSEYVAIVLVD